MSNDFYNYGSTLQPNTLARSELVATELSAITSAFALLPRLAQICENRTTFGVDSGTANTYLITVPNPPAAYTTGLRVPFVPLNNSVGASTVNIYNSNGVLIGAKAILRGDGTATGAGDISTAGLTDLQYNGTAFIMMGVPAGLVSAASGSATAAAASAAAAASSASSAAASSSSASGSAGTATGAASTATTAATSATASAGTATTGATNASTSATAASTSQGAAATSATAAAGSATAASGSATAAATSATAAATSATTATGAATSATSSSTSASTAATNAANSAATALAAANSAGWTKVGFMTHAGSPYTVQQSDGGTLFSVDTSGGAVTINLPQISGLVTPYVVGFKKETGDGNAVTINCGGADVLDTGLTSASIASVQGMTLLPHPTSPVEWLTSNWGGAAYTASLGVKLNGADIELNFPGLSTKTTPIGADSLAGYDSVGLTHVKFTITQLIAALALVAGPGSSTADNLAAFNGTGGGTLEDSGVPKTAVARKDTAQTFTKAQIGAVVPLTDAATVALDLSAGNNFFLAVAGNRTLGVPTNPVAGTGFEVDVLQDPTGSRTLAYAWIYTWAGGSAVALSTAGCSFDRLFGTVAYYGTSVVTTTIAAPGVMTWTGHGLSTGMRLQLTTTGALPTGLSANTTYWITKIDANTFNLSTSLANCAAGTFITTTGSQSGTHTAVAGDIGLALNKAFA